MGLDERGGDALGERDAGVVEDLLLELVREELWELLGQPADEAVGRLVKVAERLHDERDELVPGGLGGLSVLLVLGLGGGARRDAVELAALVRVDDGDVGDERRNRLERDVRPIVLAVAVDAQEALAAKTRQSYVTESGRRLYLPIRATAATTTCARFKPSGGLLGS